MPLLSEYQNFISSDGCALSGVEIKGAQGELLVEPGDALLEYRHQPLRFLVTGHQAGDVDEFDDRRDHLLGPGDRRKLVGIRRASAQI